MSCQLSICQTLVGAYRNHLIGIDGALERIDASNIKEGYKAAARLEFLTGAFNLRKRTGLSLANLWANTHENIAEGSERDYDLELVKAIENEFARRDEKMGIKQ